MAVANCIHHRKDLEVAVAVTRMAEERGTRMGVAVKEFGR
jgi:hypothetical protein